MNRLSAKKLLLSSLIALQITSGFTNQSISEVYAQETVSENDDIQMIENDKKLLLIALTYGDYKDVTLGYKFSKDNAVWFKDAMTGRTYNMNRVSSFIHYPELVYTEIEDVLPENLKSRTYLTRDEAEDIIGKYKVVDAVVQLPDAADNYYDFVYQTFGTDAGADEDLHIANCSLFKDPYDVFNSFTVEDDFNEKTEVIDASANDYKLGIYEYPGVYKCYSSIYDEYELKTGYKGGIITRLYVFDENGNYLKSLYTQKQIDEFIESNQENLNSYTWKAAIHLADNIDDILIDIKNNKVVPSKETTIFISYKPKSKTLEKK